MVSYKERQMAEGRREKVIVKTLVVGLKATLKKYLLRRVQAYRNKASLFNPTFKKAETFCLLPSYFCFLKSCLVFV